MRKKLTIAELDHENGSRLRRQVVESQDKAVKVAIEKTRDTIGILVDAEEYALLRAVYDLATSPDGPSKLAGTYDYRTSNTIPYENALEHRR
jgi:hypothetical protein